jgi:hypothetical protein
MSYDEEFELTRYVWRHYAYLMMSDFEHQVAWVAQAHEMAAFHRNPTLACVLVEQKRLASGPEVDAALSAGLEAFRRAVACRILSERSGEVKISRCSRCQRVLRTPVARQCFWCGHDWHGTDG